MRRLEQVWFVPVFVGLARIEVYNDLLFLLLVPSVQCSSPDFVSLQHELT